MKKNWFYLIMSMVLVAMPLTSCDDDDEPINLVIESKVKK